MEAFIKNIILYDSWRNVSGFAELKNVNGRTQIKIRHNLTEKELTLSVVGEDGSSHLFQLNTNSGVFEIAGGMDLNREVVACLCVRDGNKVTTVSSGIINAAKPKVPVQESENTAFFRQRAGAELPQAEDMNPHKIRNETNSGNDAVSVIDETAYAPIERNSLIAPVKAAEIDELLRKVCAVDDKGKGQCETCPYRDYFFEFTLNRRNRDELKIETGKRLGIG